MRRPPPHAVAPSMTPELEQRLKVRPCRRVHSLPDSERETGRETVICQRTRAECRPVEYSLERISPRSPEYVVLPLAPARMDPSMIFIRGYCLSDSPSVSIGQKALQRRLVFDYFFHFSKALGFLHREQRRRSLAAASFLAAQETSLPLLQVTIFVSACPAGGGFSQIFAQDRRGSICGETIKKKTFPRPQLK